MRLDIGGAVYDPTDPVGRLLFNVLGMVAEFEADLIRARTREGMAVAKARGKLQGPEAEALPAQERQLVALHRAGDHSDRGARRAVRYRPRNGLPGARPQPIADAPDLTLPRVEGA